MEVGEALLEGSTGRAEASFALFAQTLDAQWIAAALQATGAASVRRRKPPAEYVVWLVIGMGLLRDRASDEGVPPPHLLPPRGKAPRESLPIVDRGFLSYLLLHQIQTSGANRHWLSRAQKNLTWRVRQRLGPHDSLVDLPVHRNLRRAHPELPETLTVRAIRYQRRGFRPQTLLTPLLDPTTPPAPPLLALHPDRRAPRPAVSPGKPHHLQPRETLPE